MLENKQSPNFPWVVGARATALITGTAIGAGIFGLPFVFAQSGIGIGFIHLILLFCTVLMTMLAFGEVVLVTPGRHQLGGYAKKYLGKPWTILALVTLIVGVYGALVAYILGVGSLLHGLISPGLGGMPVMYGGVFWLVMSSILFFGLRRVAKAESILVCLLLLAIGVLVILSLPYVDVRQWLISPNFTQQPHSWLPALLPFGVVLFALGASTAVPEAIEYLRQLKAVKLTRRIIIVGMTIPLLVYAAFVLVVVGISGPATSESAIQGLGLSLGPQILVLGSFLGTLTMTTSFLALGIALHDLFRYDFKLSHVLSWMCVVVPPLLVVLIQIGSFIDFLGLAGSLVGGFDGIIILLLYEKLRPILAKKQQALHIPKTLVVCGVIVYALGIVSELFTLATKLIAA